MPYQSQPGSKKSAGSGKAEALPSLCPRTLAHYPTSYRSQIGSVRSKIL